STERGKVMQHRSVVATGVVFILVIVLCALHISIARGQTTCPPSGATCPSSGTCPIAVARLQGVGATVTVEGFVDVPSGLWVASTFDLGFNIQDDPVTPPCPGGIYVSVNTNLGLGFNKRVRVTGVLGDSFGLLILVPNSIGDVVVLSGAQKVDAEDIAICDIG